MKMFSKILSLFLGLGVIPTLFTAILFSLPHHFQIEQYKNLVGILLILSTVCTLCLAGLVTQLLKDPIKKMLGAQKEIRHGKLEYRLPIKGEDEFQKLFAGFNKMAESIEQAAKQEQQLVEAKTFGKLASQVIHDLRSPLSSLKTASDHLQEQFSKDPVLSQYVKLLHLGTKRLQEIADDLLKQKKEISTKVPFLIINKVIENLVEELRIKCPKFTFQMELCHSNPQLNMEATDLKRAMGNIVTNALEAMQEKGSLIIRTKQTTNNIRVEIVDTGPGMTPEILEKVLKGGFTYNKENGNGIGMTVVREVVEKYQGQIDAKSDLGKGTTFILQFPLQIQAPAT